MNNIKGGLGEFRMTIHVKRADTGKTETHELIGKVIEDGTDTLDNCA